MNENKQNRVPNNQQNFTEEDAFNSQKFNHIVSNYMDVSIPKIKEKFGYKTTSLLQRIRNGKAYLTTVHMLGLEHYFDIPMSIFEKDVPLEDIDRLID
ncbi:MAG: hypothetical protein U9N49_04010 [Campylobacterota bacterium]|nr:hypothetical protein [Campylobacterota bacterium]